MSGKTTLRVFVYIFFSNIAICWLHHVTIIFIFKPWNWCTKHKDIHYSRFRQRGNLRDCGICGPICTSCSENKLSFPQRFCSERTLFRGDFFKTMRFKVLCVIIQWSTTVIYRLTKRSENDTGLMSSKTKIQHQW